MADCSSSLDANDLQNNAPLTTVAAWVSGPSHDGLREINAAGLEPDPHAAVPETDDEGPDEAGGHRLEADQLALVVRWLGGPAEEVHHILGHLRLGARGAILVVDEAIGVQRAGHPDQASREVHVVVQAVADFDAGRRISVAQEQSKDVVQAFMLGRRVHTQVGRIGATVCVARGLLVRVGRREGVDQDAGSGEHLAFVVRAVDHVVAGSNLLHALLGKDEVHQVSEVKLLHRVACRANLTVDLVAATNAGDLVGMKDGLHPEWIARRMWRILVIALGWHRPGDEGGAANSGSASHGAREAPGGESHDRS
mmetsp:Transcript_72271/g.169194  ORF Transcript_72271/g.169194 Transcript_72271/m.169194 type:complete len:310 (-) Transcript_72271:40-969(-)